MDILKPPLIWIGKRCYRKNETQHYRDEDPYEDDEIIDSVDDVYEDEVCDAFTPIEQTDSGYRLALTIPSVYFKFIIGKRAETKKRLENETRTQIRIPKAGEEGDVVIIGRDRKGILSAKTRIELLVDSARQKQPFTHFISLPVAGQEFKECLEEFKTEVLSSCGGDRGVDESIFQNPNKLHMTLGILALMNEEEVTKATTILHQCQHDLVQSIFGDEPLLVNFEGLEYMNDDPGEVDVLYVKIKDPSDRLQTLSDRIVDRLVSSGLMRQEYDRVKLHITIMNTLFRKDPTGVAAPQKQTRKAPAKDRESFNAQRILQLFGDYDFGSFHIKSVHLSQRGATGPDGYYGNAASIQLP